MTDPHLISVPVDRFGPSPRKGRSDWLTVEAPLEIRVNGVPFTVTMRTPGEDADLALGLLFTEGVLTDPSAELTLNPSPCAQGVDGSRLEVRGPPDKLLFSGGGRSLISASSCGLCGKTSLEDLPDTGGSVPPQGRLRRDLIGGLQEKMAGHQAGFHRSGGVHAAAAFTLAGELLAVREDIGRHNAVDKVIGALIAQGDLGRAAAMTVSGRVSYEIVTKAARAAIQHLIAVSAPSSLAVGMCESKGITLVGFCRDGRFTVYAHPEGLMPGRDPGGQR